MAKRYIGDAIVTLTYKDATHKIKDHYAGTVKVGRYSWRFIIHPAPAGFGPGIAYDSSEAYDDIAASAARFGSTPHGDDPDKHTAREIDDAVSGWMDDRGRVAVARSHGGPVRWI